MSATMTLGALAASTPGAAELFEHLELDYCCGGERSLAAACQERGLDPDVVLDRLAATEAAESAVPDLTALSTSELCEHIVVAHHGPLRVALARLTKLLATVVRVHGADQAELHELERTFLALRREVEEHLALEERALFPACVRLDGARPDGELLVHLRGDHREVGDALGRMRGLTAGWDVSRARCATHRELLLALQTFEREMHRHIHEENTILFPRVLAPTGAPPPA
jgi:regulator of cell morphogenesis and NO signaling